MKTMTGFPRVLEIMEIWKNGEGFKRGQDASLNVYEVAQKLGMTISRNTAENREKASRLQSTMSIVANKFMRDYTLVFGGIYFTKEEPIRYLIAKEPEEYAYILERLHRRKEVI